jgi:hypothetical protein
MGNLLGIWEWRPFIGPENRLHAIAGRGQLGDPPTAQPDPTERLNGKLSKT